MKIHRSAGQNGARFFIVSAKEMFFSPEKCCEWSGGPERQWRWLLTDPKKPMLFK